MRNKREAGERPEIGGFEVKKRGGNKTERKQRKGNMAFMSWSLIFPSEIFQPEQCFGDQMT